ncbi:MAG: DinB family protein [Chloroflexi bacterium]|nr:DinB family protein [Chloroflexota bacterium]
MNKNDIQLLYKYNAWANARILNAASNVTREQFLAPAAFPHGGLRGTLTHALFAEWLWRKRWEGDSPTQFIKPEEFPTFESLCVRWQEEERKLSAFIENLADEKLNSVIEYKTTSGKPMHEILWKMMAHVVNHGTQHRSEAAALLTDFGRSPGDIDLIVFLREM